MDADTVGWEEGGCEGEVDVPKLNEQEIEQDDQRRAARALAEDLRLEALGAVDPRVEAREEDVRHDCHYCVICTLDSHIRRKERM